MEQQLQLQLQPLLVHQVTLILMSRSCSCSSFKLGFCNYDWECPDGPCCIDNTCGHDGRCRRPRPITTTPSHECSVKEDCPEWACCIDNMCGQCGK